VETQWIASGDLVETQWIASGDLVETLSQIIYMDAKEIAL
jgi:hypothetical protein